jgi:hypothetical protein
MTMEKKILQDVENSPKLRDIVTDILIEKKKNRVEHMHNVQYERQIY